MSRSTKQPWYWADANALVMVMGCSLEDARRHVIPESWCYSRCEAIAKKRRRQCMNNATDGVYCFWHRGAA